MFTNLAIERGPHIVAKCLLNMEKEAQSPRQATKKKQGFWMPSLAKSLSIINQENHKDYQRL